MPQREPRQVFWILVFLALATILAYIVSLLFVPGSMWPVLGLLSAAGGLALWGTVRLYKKQRWIPALIGTLVTFMCGYLALLTCAELSEELPFLTSFFE